jgi:hypothetical protein
MASFRAARKGVAFGVLNHAAAVGARVAGMFRRAVCCDILYCSCLVGVLLPLFQICVEIKIFVVVVYFL